MPNSGNGMSALHVLNQISVTALHTLIQQKRRKISFDRGAPAV